MIWKLFEWLHEPKSPPDRVNSEPEVLTDSILDDLIEDVIQLAVVELRDR